MAAQHDAQIVETRKQEFLCPQSRRLGPSTTCTGETFTFVGTAVTIGTADSSLRLEQNSAALVQVRKTDNQLQ